MIEHVSPVHRTECSIEHRGRLALLGGLAATGLRPCGGDRREAEVIQHVERPSRWAAIQDADKDLKVEGQAERVHEQEHRRVGEALQQLVNDILEAAVLQDIRLDPGVGERLLELLIG